MNIIIDLGNIWEMLSAIGTIGAVVLSLWLSRRNELPRLYVHYCMNYSSDLVEKTHIFEIVNIGTIPTTVIDEGLSLFNRKYFNSTICFQGVVNSSFSSKDLATPYSNTLRPGESMTIEIEFQNMIDTVNLLMQRKNKSKCYFYIIDSTCQMYFTKLSVKGIVNE